MSLTELPADSLKLERHIQCSLMMQGTLLVRVTQALFNETEIDARILSIWDRTQTTGHLSKIALLDRSAQGAQRP
jgi:hypothetical protein